MSWKLMSTIRPRQRCGPGWNDLRTTLSGPEKLANVIGVSKLEKLLLLPGR